VLEVNDLSVAYGKALALHDINMTIKSGEMVFIVGRNGSGKTTLMKTICGLLKPQSGYIRFNNNSVGGMSAEVLARQGIGFVAQDKKVFSELTVASNIDLAAHAGRRDPKEAVETVVSLYPKMERFLNKKAGSLSGGQREILLIGRALVGEPDLLLIDEPTEGLAAIVIKDIFRILSRMKAQRATLIVEQNLSLVSQLADRVYIMKEGRVIREMSTAKEIADIASLESEL
jgi:ABC-type branched-subunit amino acid transport system ATPase component